MDAEESRNSPVLARARVVATSAIAIALCVGALCWFDDPLQARGVALASVYLTFALSEVVAPFVPTLFLLAATPLVLGPVSPHFSLSATLAWTADPVLALFAGGLAVGVAAQRHRIDVALAAFLLRIAGQSRRRLIAVVLFATAFMSMWLSNVAAAALLLAALRPALSTPIPPAFRRSLWVALALGANLGGMSTPIGSGPNAIAIAQTREIHRITFAEWMSFGLPITIGMGLVAYVWLVLRYRVSGEFELHLQPPVVRRRAWVVVALFAIAILAWLTEPLHGISAPAIAVMLVLVLFGSSLLAKSDLGELDWSTLGLIAGGLALGRLLESTGLLAAFSNDLALAYPRWVWLGGLVIASAGLAAVMSNTATAAMLVPLGLQLDGSPATAIVIAVAASFGMPFPISTPPNALVYGTGDIRTRDLLEIGAVLMLVGCAVVTFTGPWFLRVLGIP